MIRQAVLGGLIVIVIGGCAPLTPSQQALRTCFRQRSTTETVAGTVGTALLGIPVGMESIPICMGNSGWIADGYKFRPMTTMEQEAWPDQRSALREYEQQRADSIRPAQ